MRLKDPDKYELAKRLYINEKIPLKEIAARLNTTPQTLTRWKQKGAWAEKRQAAVLSPRALYRKLLKQLDLLIEEGTPSGNADAISKICKQVKELQKGITADDVILAFSDFGDWLMLHAKPMKLDEGFFQRLTSLQDAYLHHLIATENPLDSHE